MKAKIIFFLILGFQTSVSKSQHEYVSDSSKIHLSPKQCSRFIIKSTKRITKLQKRVKSTNDLYLKNFREKENEMLQKFCLLDEIKAEALIQDSWYSINRFESKLKRNNAQKAEIYYQELDTLSSAVSFYETKSGSCECNGLLVFKKAREDLNEELKRTEAIQSYINERNSFLNLALGNNSDFHPILNELGLTSKYFNSRIGELKGIFGTRSNFENVVLSKITSSLGFDDFISVFGQIPKSIVPTGQVIVQPQLKIEDLLSDLDQNTSDLTSPLSSTAENIPEQFNNEMQDTFSKVSSSSVLDVNESILSTDSVLNKKASDSKNQKSYNPLKTKRFIDRLNYWIFRQS